MKTLCSLFGLLVSTIPLTACVGIGGETIALSHEPLAAPSQKYSEKLAIQKPAQDLREEKDRIGRATITVFAITSGSITTTSPVEEQLVQQVGEALSSLGYRVDLSEAGRSTGVQARPLKMTVALNDMWFRNYNWTWPIVRTWGDMKITVAMENAGGKKLFEKAYQGDGSSLCLSGHCAFENATRQAMTEVLNQITRDFSSSPVRDLIVAETQSAPPSE